NGHYPETCCDRGQSRCQIGSGKRDKEMRAVRLQSFNGHLIRKSARPADQRNRRTRSENKLRPFYPNHGLQPFSNDDARWIDRIRQIGNINRSQVESISEPFGPIAAETYPLFYAARGATPKNGDEISVAQPVRETDDRLPRRRVRTGKGE